MEQVNDRKALARSILGFSMEHCFDPEAEIPSSKPIVFLSGSWYEMGRQYVQRAGNAFFIKTAEGLAAAIKICGSRENAYAQLPAYLRAMEEKAPDMLALWNGMADASGMEQKDIYLAYINFRGFREHCSNISAWGRATKDHCVITGMNCDESDTANYYSPMVIAAPEHGYRFISASGITCNSLMNEKGLVMMASCGQSALFGDVQPGLPNCMGLMACIASCATAEAAAEKIIQEKSGPGSGENMHLCDARGSAYVIEHTARANAIRRAGENGETDYLLATNRFFTPEMQASIFAGEAAHRHDSSLPRYWTEAAILKSQLGALDLDGINKALRCNQYFIRKDQLDMWETAAQTPAPGWGISNASNLPEYEAKNANWSPELRSPFQKTVFSVLTRPQKLEFYITNGCGNTLFSGNPNATGNFLRVVLRDSFRSITQELYDDARVQIWLSARHIARSALRGKKQEYLLNLAKEALFHGVHRMNIADCAASAPERETYYGEAASFFAEAQCYGQLAQESPYAVWRNGRETHMR